MPGDFYGEFIDLPNQRRVRDHVPERLPRSDLSGVIYDALGGPAELILDDTVQDLTDDDGVRVAFQKGRLRGFALVIGADGLHSRV